MNTNSHKTMKQTCKHAYNCITCIYLNKCASKAIKNKTYTLVAIY